MPRAMCLLVNVIVCVHWFAALDAKASAHMNDVPIFSSAICSAFWSQRDTADHSLDVSEAYSHDDSNYGGRNSDWMSCLPDGRRFSELSLPGTHETMALYGVSTWDFIVDNPGSVAEDLGKAQTMSLMNQLQAGIRVLDIRCKNDHNAFQIYHYKIFQHADFDTVLQTIGDFLRQHPHEAVFMRVREEIDQEGSTRGFAETFNDYVNRYNGLFATYTTGDPSLGELRGKIVVLKDNFDSSTAVGINYQNLQAQDDYALWNKSDLYAKWTEVKNFLTVAISGDSEDPETPYINYLSAYCGIKLFGEDVPCNRFAPWFIASGKSSHDTNSSQELYGLFPKGSCPDFPHYRCAASCFVSYAGTNQLTSKYLGSIYANGRVGIIMADFPGRSLIDNVIAHNASLE